MVQKWNDVLRFTAEWVQTIKCEQHELHLPSTQAPQDSLPAGLCVQETAQQQGMLVIQPEHLRQIINQVPPETIC